MVTTGLIDTWEFNENNFILGNWCEFHETHDYDEEKYRNKILKKINVIKNMKDPDQRNYYVSNKKIEKKGFKAKIKIEKGIDDLIKIFTYNKEKIVNNY